MNHSFLDKCITLFTRPWFLLLWFMLLAVSYVYLDKPVALYFYGLYAIHLPYPLVALTSLGKNSLIMPILVLSVIFFWKISPSLKWQSRMLWLTACVIIPNLVTGVLKIILGRARPEEWFWYQKYGFFGFNLDANFWSMPSGHTTTVIGLSLGLVYLWPRWRYLWLSVGLVVAASRILLWKHYISDVLSAVGLTVIMVGIVLQLFRQTRYHESIERKSI